MHPAVFAGGFAERNAWVSDNLAFFGNICDLVVLIEKFIQRVDDQVSFSGLQVKVNHGCFYITMSQEFFDGVYINTCIQQMCSKAMPQGMGFMALVRQPCIFIGQPNAVLYGAGPHGFSGFCAFKDVHSWFNFLLAVIVSQGFYYSF